MNWEIYKLKEETKDQQEKLDAKSATRRDSGGKWKTRRMPWADLGALAKSEKDMQDDIWSYFLLYIFPRFAIIFINKVVFELPGFPQIKKK
eukprot:COSAG05_NODE_8422_length_705_cov_1.320132_1_plen_91_part_00